MTDRDSTPSLAPLSAESFEPITADEEASLRRITGSPTAIHPFTVFELRMIRRFLATLDRERVERGLAIRRAFDAGFDKRDERAQMEAEFEASTGDRQGSLDVDALSAALRECGYVSSIVSLFLDPYREQIVAAYARLAAPTPALPQSVEDLFDELTRWNGPEGYWTGIVASIRAENEGDNRMSPLPLGLMDPHTIERFGRNAEQPTGAQLIAVERHRQITEEGYDAAHDDEHADELAMAGAAYAAPIGYRDMSRSGEVPLIWPWDPEVWKPTPDDRVRELVKAGALIAAAIDSLLAEQPR